MDENDAKELEWWRTVFATRFMTGTLPRPGTGLLGLRLRLVNDDTGQVWDRDSWGERHV